jgi:hypothetical protein
MHPEKTQEDEIVATLYGGKAPFILRAHPENKVGYFLVGPTYVYGLMDGEAVIWRDEGHLEERVLT